jgi:predicted aldo/keto reductase-like oxidoreductase
MADEILRRRAFLQRLGGGAAALGLGGAIGARAEAPSTSQPASEAASQPAERWSPELTIRDLPKRELGRTGVHVPVLSLGVAPMGHAMYAADQFEPVVEAAIAAGIRYIDTAPIYDVADERLAPLLARHRDKLFLVSKTESPTRDGTLKLIEQSLRKMKTDRLDLCHIHNAGSYETQQVLGKDGMLAGIHDAQKRGLVRFIGASGHMRPARFVPILDTGEIDVLMVAMNFVDRYIYNFEQRVLPTARKHKTAIVVMKSIGGVQGGWRGYYQARPGQLIGRDYRYAIRYAMEIPDMATIVFGAKTLDELAAVVQAVRGYKPLTSDEKAMLARRGQALAAQWGEHFGPAA